MSTLIRGIGELVTCAGDDLLGIRYDAAIVVEHGRIAWVGDQASSPEADDVVDVEGRAVIPSFIDSHTHLAFAGDRSAEFAARMTGTAYDGGGIAVTRAATVTASDDDLRILLATRVGSARAQGTGTIEIKSGYGLDVEQEARLLRLAGEFTSETTFLGAHVVPPEVDRSDYLRLVTGAMLSACAPHAKWIDVFCEPHSAHAFDGDEARAVLTAGADAGLGLRVHGGQLGFGPGVQLAVELDAASVDHCTYLSPSDIDALASSPTIATLLPGVEFSTRSPYPDARALIDAGVQVALATDCNPGTCYSNSMPLMIALAVREMGMSPAEALRAATVMAARSLRRSDIGTIAAGQRAELTVLEAPTYLHLAYRPGVPIAHRLTVR